MKNSDLCESFTLGFGWWTMLCHITVLTGGHLLGLIVTLFVTTELKRTIEAIYTYPLREYARESLNRQLKLGISDKDLIKLVVSLREDGKLSIIHDDEERYKEPHIICSMGLKK